MSSSPSDQLDLLGNAALHPNPASDLGRLGIVLDQNTFMEFLTREWLLPDDDGQLFLSVGRACSANALPDSAAVAVWFDRAKLPKLPMMAWRNEAWVACAPDELSQQAGVISWNGPLPLFAASHFRLASKEARAHLLAMVRNFADMEVPAQPMEVGSVDVTPVPPVKPSVTSPMTPPHNWDALRGAAAMAAWAVPGIDPWLNLLCESVSKGESNASAELVDAPWWRTAPWACRLDDTQDMPPLWRAILSELSRPRLLKEWRPKSILEAICVRARTLGCDEARVNRLSESTGALLEDRATIKDVGLMEDALALTLQLLLLRPSPERFMRWREDWPAIPPSVWWTGMTLSGYVCGFGSLPVQWRGSPAARKLLALRTWSLACGEVARPWGDMVPEKVDWAVDDEVIRLRAGDEVWAEHKVSGRGRWYRADFNDEVLRREAEAVAMDFCPELLQQHLVFQDASFPLLGDGSLKVNAKRKLLTVAGRVEIIAGVNVAIESRLDLVRFKHWLATASIAERLPRPSVTGKITIADSPSVEANPRVARPLSPVSALDHPGVLPEDLNVRDARRLRSPKDIPLTLPRRPDGLDVLAEFISEQEEVDLLSMIDASTWDTSMRRRVQHYGWQYDYKSRKVSPSAYLGALPEWARVIAHRLVERGVVTEEPDQVIVNEYEGKQGITKHIDCVSCFRGAVVTISLNEAWEMLFSRTVSSGKVEKYAQLLARRSAAVLDGDARSLWQHEIPSRLKEAGVPRGRRVSITFRRVNAKS